ncbi:MAG: endonuclease III [Spirochaetes bacterium]|nr:endonuclease III [Spirochaetota bacterium]
MPPRDWERILHLLRGRLEGATLPSVSIVAREFSQDPFRILVSTILSLRTKDKVTLEASQRLLKRAPTPKDLLDLPEEEIQSLIYPVGFYRVKAKNLKEIARQLIDRFEGSVPANRDLLLSLPGVGRKTANLVLNLGYGIPAICVDTHVHRISNRLGWVSTRTPEQTEYALMKVLPEPYWIPINEVLVAYGQHVCTPQSPRCSTCPLDPECPKVGVTRQR